MSHRCPINHGFLSMVVVAPPSPLDHHPSTVIANDGHVHPWKKGRPFHGFVERMPSQQPWPFWNLDVFSGIFWSIIPVSGRITPIYKPLEKPFGRGPTYNWDAPPSTPPKFNTSPLKAMVVGRLLSFWVSVTFQGRTVSFGDFKVWNLSPVHWLTLFFSKSSSHTSWGLVF